MKGRFTINQYPFGIISDVHGNISNLEKIFAAHPEIDTWFCLGDIVDFLEPHNNRSMMDWWLEHAAKIPLVRGNHEEMVVKNMDNISFTHRAFLVEKLYTSIELLLPDESRLLLYHNKPKCNWSFVDKNYTEREFIDAYLDISDDVEAVCIGHNHDQFVLSFPNTFTKIWSVGAVKFGAYSIVDDTGLHHRRLDGKIYSGN